VPRLHHTLAVAENSGCRRPMNRPIPLKREAPPPNKNLGCAISNTPRIQNGQTMATLWPGCSLRSAGDMMAATSGARKVSVVASARGRFWHATKKQVMLAKPRVPRRKRRALWFPRGCSPAHKQVIDTKATHQARTRGGIPR
jgi:hypothetical protein